MRSATVWQSGVKRLSGAISSKVRWPFLLLLAVVPVLGMYGGGGADEPEGGAAAAAAAAGVSGAELDVDALLERAWGAQRGLKEAEAYIEREVRPIERVLLQYRRDPELVRRIALALVRQARRVELEPRLLLAVLLVENPMLEPGARSPVGATGLMQVMPLHRGRWPGCKGDLVSIETNVCYGASIFADFLRREGGNVERALLRYNGCVRGTNTPNCGTYPYHVYARAGRASILAWLEPPSGRAAAP